MKPSSIQLPALKPWQKDLMDALEGSIGSGLHFVIKSPRQRGKSFTICVAAISYAIQKPGSTTIIIEPTNKQCKRLFNIFMKGCRQLVVKSVETTTECTLLNGSQIIFRSAEAREALRGYTVDGALFIDEAAYITQDVFEIILQFTTVARAPIIYFSSPAFAEGFFYDMYIRGMAGDPMVRSFDWSDTDRYDFSEFITKEQIAFYKKIYSKQKFTSEVLGQFVKDMSFVFGNFTECIEEPDDQVITAVGIDWGTGKNNDSTVLVGMNGKKQVVSIWATNSLSPTQQIDFIAKILNGLPSVMVCLVELNSIGSVYYDMLVNKIANKQVVQGFNTSNESKREIIEDLIAAFGLHNISILPDSELRSQLSFYSMEATQTGKVTYNAPEGMHDDYVIALALAYRAVSQLVASAWGGFGFTSRK